MSTIVQPEERPEVEATIPVEISEDLIDQVEEVHQEEGGSEEAPLDPREEIARRFEERKLQQMGVNVDQEANEEGSEEEAGEEGSEEETGETPILTKEPIPDTISIKVNGRVLEVDRAKVEAAGGVELYQKQVAVNDGFQVLADERRQLQDAQAQFEALQRERDLQAQQPVEPQPVPIDPSTTADQKAKQAETVRKYREALLDGDDVTADSMLMELLASAQPSPAPTPIVPPKVDVEEIKQQVAQEAAKLVQQTTKEEKAKKAVSTFLGENPELLTDSRLSSAVDAETVVVGQEHPEWEPDKVLKESLNRVNIWRKPPAPAEPLDKIAEKRKLSTPVGGDIKSTPPVKPTHPTDSEYVQNLRKARGLE